MRQALRGGPGGAAEAGFTLLELLAALVVMGFVVVMLAQGFRFGTVLLGRAGGHEGDTLAIERAFDHLVEQADPGVYPQPATLRGTADTLTVTTMLPAGDAALPIRADAVLLALHGRLLLRWRAHAHVEWFGTAPGWSDTVIAEGVDHVRFAYYPRTGGPAWSSAWTDERLPALVRMTLVMAGAKAAQPPPMIAAALREPIEE
jgi:general secretion pathway protein J